MIGPFIAVANGAYFRVGCGPVVARSAPSPRAGRAATARRRRRKKMRRRDKRRPSVQPILFIALIQLMRLFRIAARRLFDPFKLVLLSGLSILSARRSAASARRPN